jgi:hypothetical protein
VLWAALRERCRSNSDDTSEIYDTESQRRELLPVADLESLCDLFKDFRGLIGVVRAHVPLIRHSIPTLEELCVVSRRPRRYANPPSHGITAARTPLGRRTRHSMIEAQDARMVYRQPLMEVANPVVLNADLFFG